MNADSVRAIEEAIDLCLRARERLGEHGSSQTCLLLDMLLLDLGTQLAQATKQSEH